MIKKEIVKNLNKNGFLVNQSPIKTLELSAIVSSFLSDFTLLNSTTYKNKINITEFRIILKSFLTFASSKEGIYLSYIYSNWISSFCDCFISKPVIQLRADLPNNEVTRFQAHTDSEYNGTEELDSFTIWQRACPLELNTGNLSLLPASHEKIKSANTMESNVLESYKGWTEIKEKENQLLIFNQNTVHQGGLNRSEYIRFTVQFRFVDVSKIEQKSRYTIYETTKNSKLKYLPRVAMRMNINS